MPIGFTIWHVAVAPDDSNFVIAITGDSASAVLGPKQFWWSNDGGGNWQNVIAPALAANEYISCIDISKKYGTSQSRDIAFGTRITGVGGNVYNIRYSSALMGNWSLPGLAEAITSLKFSPNYDQDFAIATISCTAGTTFFHLGKHDPVSNTTQWDAPEYVGYPINIGVTNATLVINTNLQLPSDFLATDLSRRACFASIFGSNATSVRYINSNIAGSGNPITPPITVPGSRIYSIAYKGSVSTGILLASEYSTAPSRGMVNVWQCSNPQSSTAGAATWLKSDVLKSPTGGANSGRANGILAWSNDGNIAYCGSSSENTTLGGTGWNPGRWPFSKLTNVALDESAFSRSADNGFSWNQISLIDTSIDKLSDVAALEIPSDTADPEDHSVLYLSSLNTDNTTYTFDSVWRSTSDPLGRIWERILIWNSNDAGTILRMNPRDTPRSDVIVFADLATDNITYSDDEGQTWLEAHANMMVRDISLEDDSTLFVLEDYSVRKVTRSGAAWTLGKKVGTNLLGPGHTICTPFRSVAAPDGRKEELVIVGTTGAFDSYVAWADFSQIIPKFTQLKQLRARGDVHVAIDPEFHKNKFIYAAQNNATLINPNGNDGVIWRWSIGKSTDWEALEPINRAFFGADMIGNVFYGAWNFNTTTLNNGAGVDRTLYPREKVPPPPEWDQLPTDNQTIRFTREPASLKTSTNTYNTLWAIDDKNYQFTSIDNRIGCLWAYIDSVAKLGPWPVSPPPGGFIGPDTVTGRSRQIDFKWRPLNDIIGYDLLIAKDVDFTLLLSQNIPGVQIDNLTGAYIVIPADQTAPACWMSPGALEAGRPYYWRVRGSRAISDNLSVTNIIHSPWSATMFFSVKPGFSVRSDYYGPNLLTPLDGPCADCKPPIRFSWTPVEGAKRYEIVLARDAELKDIITTGTSVSTAFEYKDKLELSKPYYWQVRVIAPVESDPSPVATFTLTVTKATPTTTPAQTKTKSSMPAPSDFWVWIIIVIVTLLLVLINLFAFISRRRD